MAPYSQIHADLSTVRVQPMIDHPAPPVPPTGLITGGGCTAKMGPGQLADLLAGSGLALPGALAGPINSVPSDILVGLQTGDDAAVVRLSDDLALVQTVDFFPPVVGDPGRFGAIAAANAMSDVFAMGGHVLTVLSILAVPEELPAGDAAAILRGAADKVAEAGGQIVGGHTLHGPQVMFGLAVTGRVHPDRYWARSTARPGDVLYLTKPLGVALLMTADRAGMAGRDDVEAAVASMLRLNLGASEAVRATGVPSAVTDVTGFGLLGHLAEMVTRSGVGAELAAARMPVLAGARRAAEAGCLCGGLHRNREYWLAEAGRERLAIVFDGAVDGATRAVLWDPQTSGGLLVAIPAADAVALERTFAERGEPLWRIGRVTARPGIQVGA